MTHDLTDKALVHIVDDDESVRYTLCQLLRSVGLHARAYGSVTEFTSQPLPDKPGCLVLDVRLPGVSGLEFQGQLNDLGIFLPVIFMTGHGDIPMSVRAMKAGAVDFLPKPFRDQDMLDAISSAIGRDHDRRANTDQAADIYDRFTRLTPREQEVMMFATSGKMNKQTAGYLGISIVTVKIHRRAAMTKMEARTLPDLVRMADMVRPMLGIGYRQ
ncbi:response regulator transcription factor [Rhizobium viscosum]|uniref:FixJ family two-component response regulator n=1 Tax=Rhizobium viscosum TaxID=1673 RepID=A0ABR9IXM1_RHIVS|nr:response regulator transcription factor [Rhizobium viscosum]MBE1507976.1 FixJ family two-component response regulator [Rhizobium viscosum]